MARYASQPTLPAQGSQMGGFSPGFGMPGVNRYSRMFGIGPNSNIAQAGNLAQANPNPVTQTTPKPQSLATTQGIQAMAKQADATQNASRRARGNWLEMLTPYLNGSLKTADVQTGGASAPAASTQSLGNATQAAPNSLGSAPAAQKAGPAGASGQMNAGGGSGGMGVGGMLGNQVSPVVGGRVGAYGVVQPGWAALKPAGAPGSSTVTFGKQAFVSGAPQPVPGLTANQPAPPGPPGMAQAAPPGLPPTPPPNGGAPVPMGMGQPSLDPATGQPMGAQPQQPGQPAQPAQGAAPPPQQSQPDPVTGQPTTSPMQDPPPLPLPANPRATPPRPMMPSDHAQMGLTDDLFGDKALADNPTSSGEAAEDMQAEASALGSKTAGDFTRRLMWELAQATPKSAFGKSAGDATAKEKTANLKRLVGGIFRAAPKPSPTARSVSSTAPTTLMPPGGSLSAAAGGPKPDAPPMEQVRSLSPLLHHWLSTGQRVGWSAAPVGVAAGGLGMSKAAMDDCYAHDCRPDGRGGCSCNGACRNCAGSTNFSYRKEAAAELDRYGRPRIFDSAGREWFLLGGLRKGAAARFHRPENYDKIRDLPGGKELWAGANDWEAGFTWAWVQKAGTEDREPVKFVEIDHSACPGCKGTGEDYSAKADSKCVAFGKAAVERWAKGLAKSAADIVTSDGTNHGDHVAFGTKLASKLRSAAADQHESRLLFDRMAEEMYASRFGKEAAQDADGSLTPARSATGESKGLRFNYKADHHATGQEAWASVSEYFKGHGKRGKNQPDPSLGKHALDAALEKVANPGLRAAQWGLGMGEKYLPGAANFTRGLFGRGAPAAPRALTAGPGGSTALVPHATANPGQYAAWQRAVSGGQQAQPGRAFQLGQAARGQAARGQVGMTAGGAALGGFGGHDTPFDTGSGLGNAALGAAAFNPYLNRVMGGRGVAALGNPVARGVQGGLLGAAGGTGLDIAAGMSGLRDSQGNPTTHFAQMGGALGTGFGAAGGLGRAVRNLAPAGGAAQRAGQKLMAFGEGGLAPIRAPFTAVGRLTGMSPAAGTAGRFGNAARMGRNAGIGLGGVIGAQQVVEGAKGVADDYLGSRLPQVRDQMAEFADDYLGSRLPALHGRVDEHLSQLGLLNQQGQFDPLAGAASRIGGGVDGLFRSLGMDPSRMSPLQKLMVLGGAGAAGGGALAGSPVLAGVGGASALAGLLPQIMPSQSQQTFGGPQAPYQPGRPQGSGPVGGVNQPQPNSPGARNEWAHQGGGV